MVHPRAYWTLLGLGLLSAFSAISGCSGSIRRDDGCVDGGVHYEVNATIPSSDDCNRCVCTAAGVECTAVACVGDGGGTCQFGGHAYAPGQQVSDDGCNTCVCMSSGEVACTARDCPHDAGRSCESLRERTSNELAKVQSCTSAAECGQPIPGSSCGCTRDWVARRDADLGAYLALRSEAATLGCLDEGGSTCDCPGAAGFACVDHTCAWNYTQEPIPDPKPEPACVHHDAGVLCVRGTPTADGERLAAGDPLQITVRSEGCFSSNCSEVQEASCSIVSGPDFQVKASFCISDTSNEGRGCTADCGNVHANCSFGQPLTAGQHQVQLGSLAVGFQVPSTLPIGGLCAGDF